MEVGRFDALSPSKGEVYGTIFGESVYAHVEEVLLVIEESMADFHPEGPEPYAAALYNLLDGWRVGHLVYDAELDAVVVRLSESDCGCDFPYRVATNDLYDLILHGTGWAEIREEV